MEKRKSRERERMEKRKSRERKRMEKRKSRECESVSNEKKREVKRETEGDALRQALRLSTRNRMAPSGLSLSDPSRSPPDGLSAPAKIFLSKRLCKELKGAFWRLTDGSFERSSTIPIRYTQEAQGGMATHEMRQSIMPFGESGLCAGIGKSR